MRKLIVCIMLLSLFSLSVLPTVPGTPPALQATASRQPSPPGSAPANWSSNRIANPGFEDWASPYDAEVWYEEAEGFSSSRPFQAPDPVKSGTFSAGVEALCPPYCAPTQSRFRGSPYADIRLLNLTFDWYSDQTLNTGLDSFFVSLVLSDGIDWREMVYVLNGTYQYSYNYTYGVVFSLEGPVQTWNRFSRNITADYEAVTEFPSLSTVYEVISICFKTHPRQTEAMRGTGASSTTWSWRTTQLPGSTAP